MKNRGIWWVAVAIMLGGCEDSTTSTAEGLGPEEEGSEEAVEASDTLQGGEEENAESDGEIGETAETDSGEETTEATDASSESDDASATDEPDTVSEEDSGSEEGDAEGEGEDATSGEQDAATENEETETGEGGGSASSEPGKSTFCSEAVSCMVEECTDSQPADEACLASCTEGLPQSEVTLAESTFNCAASTCVPLCSTNDDPGCFTTCLHTECADAMLPCFIPAVPGEESCGLGLGCLFDCTESDEPLAPCISTCYAQLTAEAQGQLVEFGPCIASPENLTFSECFDIGISCVGSSDEVTTFTCIDTLTCMESAFGSEFTPAGGPLVLFECIAEAEETAGEEAKNLFLCMIMMENDSSGGPAFEIPCEEELLTCGKPTGEGDCGALFSCLSEKCEEGPNSGLACFAGCLAANSPQAAEDYFSLNSCPTTCEVNCGGSPQTGTPPDAQCYEKCNAENCQPIFQNCFGGIGGF